MERGSKVRYVKICAAHNRFLKNFLGQIGVVSAGDGNTVLVYFDEWNRFWINKRWLEVVS